MDIDTCGADGLVLPLMRNRSRAPVQLTLEYVLADTITIAKAAQVANHSEETIRRWCEQGRFDACKPVGQWRIYRGSFIAWLRSRNNNSVSGDETK